MAWSEIKTALTDLSIHMHLKRFDSQMLNLFSNSYHREKMYCLASPFRYF